MRKKTLHEEIPKPIKPVDGQLSMWDILTVAPAKKEVQVEIKETVKQVGLPGLTLDQQKKYNEYFQKSNVTRMINYAGGGLGIELKEVQEHRTLYINKSGAIEFTFEKVIPVQPIDKILFSSGKIKPSTQQMMKVQQLANDGKGAKRVIQRTGDYNILIEYPGKVTSILPNGWTLDYTSINKVDCSQEEIILTQADEKAADPPEELKSIQERAKIGDFIEAEFGSRLIQGEIVRVYNENSTLNIVFDNNTKHTAIARVKVLKILKSA